MAVPVFLATHVYGIRVHGFGYLKHFVGPIRSIFALPLMILMFVIEFIGHLVRPVTLSVRLSANMIASITCLQSSDCSPHGSFRPPFCCLACW